MAKQRQARDRKLDNKRTARRERAAAEEIVADPSRMTLLPSGSLGIRGSGALDAQAAWLGDQRIQTVQRQTLAIQIGQLHGNQHMLQVLNSLKTNGKQTVPIDGARLSHAPNAVQANRNEMRLGHGIPESFGNGSNELVQTAQMAPGRSKSAVGQCVAKWEKETNTPDPESKQPLTNRNATYGLTIRPLSYVSKRFRGYDGTGWVIIIQTPDDPFDSEEQAKAVLDKLAEKWYRRHLRYVRALRHQLCENRAKQGVEPQQPPVRPPGDKEIVVDRPRREPKTKPNLPPKTIVIDGFPFNQWTVPKTSDGWKQLKLLIDLSPGDKATIRITRIAGHTDRVPVRRQRRRRIKRPFSTLKELSDLRANAVKKELKGFASLPEANELIAADEASVPRTASHEKRGKDRKVVVQWEQRATK